MKNIKDLSNILNLNNQKKDFDNLVEGVVDIIKKNTKVLLNKKEVFIKNNIIKIKTNSNKKFVIFLHLEKINKEISFLDKGFIVEV